MLRLRIREGLDVAGYNALEDLAEIRGEQISAGELSRLVSDGLIEEEAAVPTEDHPQGRAVLTLKGRLLADAVTRRLAP